MFIKLHLSRILKLFDILKSTILIFVIAFPINATAQYGKEKPVKEGWSITVGSGAIYAPSYLGDDDYRLSAVPSIRFSYEDKFFASVQEGIGYNVFKDQNWRIGPIVRYDFGRDEDKGGAFNVGGSDTNDLLGLGDVDGTVELGSFIEYNLRPISAKLEVLRGLGGHEGLVANASLSFKAGARLMGKTVIYSLGPNIKIVDSDYNQTYFGVNATQSAASGLAQYNADAGILSYGFGGTAIIPMDENVSMVIFANYKRLGDEAADSSLVSQRGSANQGTMGLFVNYTF